MIRIIIYKLVLVNSVYKSLGNANAIIERTDKLISIVTKNGFIYLFLNKYKRSNVNAASKQITAKKTYNLGKKYGILLIERKTEIVTYNITLRNDKRQ